MTTKTKVDIWPTLSAIMLIVIVGVLIYTFNGSINYKRDIKDIRREKDSLQAIISNRQEEIDSLTFKINSFVIIDTIKYRQEIIEKIKKRYESNINIIYTNSRNKNIELLSRNLSERDSSKW